MATDMMATPVGSVLDEEEKSYARTGGGRKKKAFRPGRLVSRHGSFAFLSFRNATKRPGKINAAERDRTMLKSASGGVLSGAL